MRRQNRLSFRIKTRCKAVFLLVINLLIVRFQTYEKWSKNILYSDAEKYNSKAIDMPKARYCCSVIQRVSAPLVNYFSCLIQVLSARKMLLDEGIPSTICIGVRSAGDIQSNFEIHAWLEVNGKILVGYLPGEKFQLLLRTSG